MQRFKILNIESEKRIDGDSKITACPVEVDRGQFEYDNKSETFEITMKTSDIEDKPLVKRELEKAYEAKQIEDNRLKIGDVL